MHILAFGSVDAFAVAPPARSTTAAASAIAARFGPQYAFAAALCARFVARIRSACRAMRAHTHGSFLSGLLNCRIHASL